MDTTITTSTDPGLPSTSFIIWCSAFVFLMTPGLGFFYSGLGSSKNALSNILMAMLCYCIITIQVVPFPRFIPDAKNKLLSVALELTTHALKLVDSVWV